MRETYEDLEDEFRLEHFLRNQLDTGKITMEEYLKLLKTNKICNLHTQEKKKSKNQQ
jgi:hypothetical protein